MRLISTLLSLACLLAVTGCTPSLESTVSGTVTLDGELLARGDVAFYPADTGTPAYGSIDPQGKYSVKTGQGEGMKPGEYVVIVKATEEMAPSSEAGAVEVLPELLTPKKYAMKQTSPLKFTIEPGEQTINLELDSK